MSNYTCKKCHLLLPITNFPKNKTKAGHSSACRSCVTAAYKVWKETRQARPQPTSINTGMVTKSFDAATMIAPMDDLETLHHAMPLADIAVALDITYYEARKAYNSGVRKATRLLSQRGYSPENLLNFQDPPLAETTLYRWKK